MTETIPSKQLYEAVSARYGLTEAPLSLTLPSGKQSYIHNRIGWTQTYLAQAGLVHQPKRGVGQFAAKVAQALASKQPINNDYLAQFASFNDFINAHQRDKDDAKSPQGHATPPNNGHSSQTPTEMIASAFTALNTALAESLPH